MKPQTERKVIRWLHIIGGTLLAVYVYSPWSAIQAFDLIMKIVILPVLIASGLWLWKGMIVKKWLG
jgi:hypothetical protein